MLCPKRLHKHDRRRRFYCYCRAHSKVHSSPSFICMHPRRLFCHPARPKRVAPGGSGIILASLFSRQVFLNAHVERESHRHPLTQALLALPTNNVSHDTPRSRLEFMVVFISLCSREGHSLQLRGKSAAHIYILHINLFLCIAQFDNNYLKKKKKKLKSKTAIIADRYKRF